MDPASILAPGIDAVSATWAARSAAATAAGAVADWLIAMDQALTAAGVSIPAPAELVGRSQ